MLSDIELQALKYLSEHPAKRGTLLVTCKGVGYGGYSREVWQSILDSEFVKWGYVRQWSDKSKHRVYLTEDGEYILKYGRLPPTPQELNICLLCRGAKGWKGVNYFVPCSKCNGDGCYHE
jgi:hypothetical protein